MANIYEQSQQQFTSALEQSQKQFEEALAQNNKNYETIFSIFREDVKYKAMLSEVLTKLEIKLDMRNNTSSRRSGDVQQ
jgi:transposase